MIGPVSSTPMMLAPQPHWKTATIDAEGGADREQVHHHRLQRHQHRAEDGHQQQRREQDDDADEERQLFGDRVAEVLEDRGDAADVELRAGLRLDRRDHVVADVVEQVGRLGALRRGRRVDLEDAGVLRRVEGDRGDRGDAFFVFERLAAAASSPASSPLLGSAATIEKRAVEAGAEAFGEQVVGFARRRARRVRCRRRWRRAAARGWGCRGASSRRAGEDRGEPGPALDRAAPAVPRGVFVDAWCGALPRPGIAQLVDPVADDRRAAPAAGSAPRSS